MLIPHLHLHGHCEEAIELYKKAFGATLDLIIFNRDLTGNSVDTGVGHAEMHIHNQRVMLNDRFGNNDLSLSRTVQMCVFFDSAEDFLECYSILSAGGRIIDPPQEASYSPLVSVFIDRYGIMWGFQVETL